MATFRSSLLIGTALVGLACAGRPESTRATGASHAERESRLIAQQVIHHVSPRRDSRGPTPSRFEWSAVDGADSYRFELQNEVSAVADSKGLATTSLEWPADARLAAGTYFWIVTAIRGTRSIASSGRSAFVVTE